MKTIDQIKGDLITGIYTKFYYAGKQLCYQIVVNYDEGQILYRDFKEYKDYRNYHNLLIDALNKNRKVLADFFVMDAKTPTTMVAKG